jgi:hypothetical protein
VTNHAYDTIVDQLLRGLDRKARICLIVLHVQDEFNRLAVDGWILRILFIQTKRREATYLEVSRTLEEKVRNGMYPPGSRLPP